MFRLLTRLLALTLSAFAMSGAADAFDVVESERSVVQVIVENPAGGGVHTGSGFVVASGVVVTNNHVVEGAVRYGSRGVVRISSTDQMYPIESIMFASEDVDLALLRVPSLAAPAAILTSVEPARASTVHVLGFPGVTQVVRLDDLQANYTKGTVSLVGEGNWTSRQRIRIIQHSADVNPGNSGGPLYDDCSRIVGVNTAKPTAINNADGVFWSSSMAVLLPILQQYGVSANIDTSLCEAKAVVPSTDPAPPPEPSTRADADTGEGEAPAPPVSGGSNALAMTALGVAILGVGAAFLGLRANRTAPAPSPPKPSAQDVGVKAPPSPKPPPSGPKPDSQGKHDRASGTAPHGLTLSGYDADGRVIQLVADARKLAGPSGVVLGRSADLADLVVSNERISRVHCRLRWDEGKFWVEDLNSLNGTVVDDEMLVPNRAMPIRPGDIIHLSTISLTISKA